MSVKKAPHPWPEADWRPVQPFPFASAREAFGGMTRDKGRLDLRYYLRERDRRLVATADFGPLSEGAPGKVHGGALLTALDEALGAAAWLADKPCLTVRLTTDFRRGVPLGARLLVETRVLSERLKVVSVEGSIVGPDGTLYASAQGRFMRIGPDELRTVFGRTA